MYRVGTLLELVREVATSLAADGKRVKVCVQQALGQGVFQVRSGRNQASAGMPWAGRLGGMALPDRWVWQQDLGQEAVEQGGGSGRELRCLPSCLPVVHAGHAAEPEWRAAHHEADGLGGERRCVGVGRERRVCRQRGVGLSGVCFVCTQGGAMRKACVLAALGWCTHHPALSLPP